jgi:hypothetical protein
MSKRIEIPIELYEKVEDLAKKQSTTVDELAVELLTGEAAVERWKRSQKDR